MKRENTKRSEVGKSELPISSMVDVVFLLLVYFIVVQKPITDERLLKASLPSKPKVPVMTKVNPDFVRIEVKKSSLDNAHYYYKLNGKTWSDTKLFSVLKHMGKINPETSIVINCGPNAKHEKLITLLDACNEAELENLNIINDAGVVFHPEIQQ